MKERIKEFIEYKGIQAGELATLLEVQRSNISHILNGRNKPGASLIEKMLIVFPDLNARWLLTGEGDMIETENNDEIVANKNINELKPSTAIPNRNNSMSNKSQVEKVILLHSDGTFTSYNK